MRNTMPAGYISGIKLKSVKKCFLFFLILGATGAKAQSIRNNEIQISPITFTGNTAKLSTAADSGLAQLQRYLTAKSYISLMRIEGHVAAGGNAQALSEQRAMAVCQWLISHGVECSRLIAVGFGNTKPASADASQNTRIVASNAALRGHPIGGMPAEGGGRNAGALCR